MTNKLREEAGKWNTGDFAIEEAPNPHGLLFDHAKTVGTLSVAFLGLSVGFAQQITGNVGGDIATWILGVVWIALIASIICIVLGSLGIHRYLFTPPDASKPDELERYKNGYNRAALQIGLAGILLASAAAVFAVGGILIQVFGHREISSTESISAAVAFVQDSVSSEEGEIELASMQWQESTAHYAVNLVDRAGGRHIEVLVDRTGKVVSFVLTRSEATER